MQKRELNSLKKKFRLRRALWGIFLFLLIYKIWYGSWKNLFAVEIDIAITLVLVALGIFGILKAGRDAEKYIKYQKSDGKNHPYMEKGLKIKGWANRFLAITFIGQSAIWIVLLILVILMIIFSLYAGVGSAENILNIKFIGSAIAVILFIVFFIWLGFRMWRKSKPLVQGEAPKY